MNPPEMQRRKRIIIIDVNDTQPNPTNEADAASAALHVIYNKRLRASISDFISRKKNAKP